MKLKNIFLFFVLAAPALLLQSCLKDQEDDFDQSSSARMSEFLANAKQVLESSENGWALDYYPKSTRDYGGFVYTIKFNGGKATVGMEGTTDQETSLYTMTNDDGPVLSFDSYNTLLHKFATPHNGADKGQEGDFEFVIDSVGTDLIKCHGKRNQNTMYFHRLTTSSADYLKQVEKMDTIFNLASADFTLNGVKTKVNFEKTNRQAQVISNNDTIKTQYVVTPEGVRLYTPTNVNGAQLWNLDYDYTKLSLTDQSIAAEKVWVSPSLVVSTITSSGVVGSTNEGQTKTYNGYRLDQITATPAASDSWLSVSKTENGLTITSAANDTGAPRTGKIILSNGDYKSTLYVTQASISQIAGSYLCSYYNYFDGYSYSDKTATLSKQGDYYEIDYDRTIKEYDDATGMVKENTGSVPMTVSYNAETATLSVVGGTGNLYSFQSGDKFYFCNAFFDADMSGMYYSHSDLYSAPLIFNADGSMTATFTGKVGNNSTISYIGQAMTTYQYPSSDTEVTDRAHDGGWYSLIKDFVLYRKATSGAKPHAKKAPQEKKGNIQLSKNALRFILR